MCSQMEPPPATNANIRNITLVEDISSIQVDDPLLNEVREWSEISSQGNDSINLKDAQNRSGAQTLDIFDRPPVDDGFGGQLGVGIVDDDMFPLPVPPEAEQQMQNDQQAAEQQPGSVKRPDSAMSDRSDSVMSFGAPASDAPSGPPSTPGSMPPSHLDEDMPFPPPLPRENDISADVRNNCDASGAPESQNTMVLEPLEGQGLERRRKRRKKLGIVVDEVKTLSGEEMKAQLSDTTDIVTSLDLAPPSKKLMNWKKTGGSEKLFALPERPIPSKCLVVYYSRHLITNRIEQEEEILEDGINGMPPPSSALPLSELEDIENQLPPLSPVQDLQPPKTPKTPSYHRTPTVKKKRKEQDRDHHHVNKKAKESEKHNNISDRLNEPFSDYSSIQNQRGSSMQMLDGQSHEIPTFQEEDEDDDYGAPMSVGPVSFELTYELLKF